MSELKTKADLLTQWQDAQDALKDAKALELELREKIVERYFKGVNDAGTYHAQVGERDVVLTKKFNYKLDQKTTLAAQQAVAEKVGQVLAARVVKWKPELSLTEYKQLPDEARAIIDEVLTITPATPAIEIK